jgi:hypothetical protein
MVSLTFTTVDGSPLEADVTLQLTASGGLGLRVGSTGAYTSALTTTYAAGATTSQVIELQVLSIAGQFELTWSVTGNTKVASQSSIARRLLVLPVLPSDLMTVPVPESLNATLYPAVYQCSADHVASFNSMDNWTLASSTLATCGLVSMDTPIPDLELPVALRGLHIDASALVSDPQDCPPLTGALQDNTLMHGLATSTLRAFATLMQQTLPSWLQLPLDLSQLSVQGVTMVLEAGAQVKARTACSFLPVQDQHLYLTMVLDQPIVLTFMGLSYTLDLGASPTQQLCGAVDVCGTLGETAMIQLPADWLPEDNAVAKAMAAQGYTFNGGAFAFSTTRALAMPKLLPMWDGISTFDYALQPGNLFFRIKALKHTPPLEVETGLRTTIDLDGTLVGGFGDLRKGFFPMFQNTWEVAANGIVKLHVDFDLLGEPYRWTLLGNGSLVASVDLGNAQARDVCGADSRNPPGLYVAARGKIPSFGPLIQASGQLDFNMYMRFSFTSRSKPQSDVDNELAAITAFTTQINSILSSVSMTRTTLASQLATALQQTNTQAGLALAGLLANHRSELNFLLRQLRDEIANDLSVDDAKSLLATVRADVLAKQSDAVESETVEAGMDAIGFRTARRLGTGKGAELCLFGSLCMEVEATLEFGSKDTLQSCSRLDEELYGTLPNDKLIIFTNASVTKKLVLFGVLALEKGVVTEMAFAPATMDFGYRMRTITTLLGASLSTKVTMNRKQIAWDYEASLFNVAWARVQASITVDNKDLTEENLRSAKIRAQGKFVARSDQGSSNNRNLAREITTKITRYVKDLIADAQSRFDISKKALDTAKAALVLARKGLDTASAAADAAIDVIGNVEERATELTNKVLELADPSAIIDSGLKAAKEKAEALCPGFGNCEEICIFCVPGLRRRRRLEAVRLRQRRFGFVADAVSSIGDAFGEVLDVFDDAGLDFESVAGDLLEVAGSALSELGLDDLVDAAANLAGDALAIVGDITANFMENCECQLYGPNPGCLMPDSICQVAQGIVSKAISEVSGVIKTVIDASKVAFNELKKLKESVSVTKVLTYTKNFAKDRLEEGLSFAEEGVKLAEKAHAQVKEATQALMDLASELGNTLLSVRSIEFDALIDRDDVSSSTLNVLIKTESGGVGTDFEVAINFDDMPGSILRIARAIAKKVFPIDVGGLLRRRRTENITVTMANISTGEIMHARCAASRFVAVELRDLLVGIGELFLDFASQGQAVQEYHDLLLDAATAGNTTSPPAFNASLFDTPTTSNISEINNVTFASLNLSSVDFSDNSKYGETSINLLVSDVFVSLNAQLELLELTNRYGFTQWRDSFNNRVWGNSSSSNVTTCASLSDCLATQVQLFKQQFEELDVDDATPLATNLTRLASLTESLGVTALSITEAMQAYVEIQQLLAAMTRDPDLVCGVGPSIASIAAPTAQAGQPLELLCNVSGKPAPSLRWYEISDPTATLTELPNLSFQALTTSHAGTYVCEARNKYGVASTPVTVAIQGRLYHEPFFSYQLNTTNIAAIASATDVELAAIRDALVLRLVAEFGVERWRFAEASLSRSGQFGYAVAFPTPDYSVATAQRLELNTLQAEMEASVLSNVPFLTFQAKSVSVVEFSYQLEQCYASCALVAQESSIGDACVAAVWDVPRNEYLCPLHYVLQESTLRNCSESHRLSGYADGEHYCRRLNDPPQVWLVTLLAEPRTWENATINTSLGVFQVYDSEDATPVNVGLKFDDAARAFVWLKPINSTFYELLTAMLFDHEIHTEECFTLQLTDTGSPALTTNHKTCLQVDNINELPTFPSNSTSSVAVDENLQTDLLLATFEATDPDHNTMLTYHVIRGGPAFVMRGSSLHVISPLNFEKQVVHNITVQVTDDGVPSLSAKHAITVTVVDQNDMPSLELSCKTDNCSLIQHPNSVGQNDLVAQLVVVDEDVLQTHTVVLLETRPVLNITLNDSLILSAHGMPNNVTAFAVALNVTDSGTPSFTATVEFLFVIQASRSNAMSRAEMIGLATGSSLLAVALLSGLAVFALKQTRQAKQRRKTQPTPGARVSVSFETTEMEYLDVEGIQSTPHG